MVSLRGVVAQGVVRVYFFHCSVCEVDAMAPLLNSYFANLRGNIAAYRGRSESELSLYFEIAWGFVETLQKILPAGQTFEGYCRHALMTKHPSVRGHADMRRVATHILLALRQTQ